MRIGIPKEVHDGEKRVATTPDVTKQLIKLGFEVSVESGAGAGSNFSDSILKNKYEIYINEFPI